MKEKLLQLFTLADDIHKANNNLYVQIEYTADDMQKIKISVISRETYTYIETLKIDVTNNPYFKWDTVFETLNCFIGGDTNE